MKVLDLEFTQRRIEERIAIVTSSDLVVEVPFQLRGREIDGARIAAIMS